MTVKGRAHLIGSSDAGRRSSQAGAAIRSHWQGHAAWLEAEGGRICGRDPLHGVPVDRGGVAALSEGRLEIEGLGCRSAIAQALESRHGLLPIRGAICLDPTKYIGGPALLDKPIRGALERFASFHSAYLPWSRRDVKETREFLPMRAPR